MKPTYSCTAAMLAILAGAALFTPHVMKAGPSSAAPKSTVSQAPTRVQKMRLVENHLYLPAFARARPRMVTLQTEVRIESAYEG